MSKEFSQRVYDLEAKYGCIDNIPDDAMNELHQHLPNDELIPYQDLKTMIKNGYSKKAIAKATHVSIGAINAILWRNEDESVLYGRARK